MKNVGIAFDIPDEGVKMPPVWTEASGNLVFAVKMDFTWKAEWVQDGHQTPDPETSAYARMVSRESVRIALTYVALMGLDVMAVNIQNAYFQVPSSEKHYIIFGPELEFKNFGKDPLIE